ncbi:unnamed protein product [Hymenolepis diminuta]|uniref:Uncharacterized protein n=1 Tax=Hymenolepis diminuta TaxID=6216 RepID=A0A0R3SM39_HYMDI|nr:unnamed protein product [Hymenolepis diminuta]
MKSYQIFKNQLSMNPFSKISNFLKRSMKMILTQVCLETGIC